MTRRLNIEDIETCGGTQTRVAINEEVVADYAEAMTNGADFPPVAVFNDGTTYYLADGFHRVMAAQRIKLKEVDAEIHKGTKQDAIVYALGANDKHGLKRTNADKRQCVKIALREFADWSDRRIAEVCGVSHTSVIRIRAEVEQCSTCPPATNSGKPAPAKRKGKDGKEYPAKPAPQAQPPEQDDEEKPPAETYSIKAKPLPPSSGMQYATLAIGQLEKINHNDTQREQALKHVANWIADQLKG